MPMGRLTNTARERFEQTRTRNRSPEWLPKVSVALSAVVGIFILFGSLAKGCDGDAYTTVTTAKSGVVIPTAPPAPTGSAPDTTLTPATSTSSGSGQVTFPPRTDGQTGSTVVQAIDGSDVEIPVVAHDAAVGHVRELLGAAARIDSVQVRTNNDQTIVFVVTADPDGLGPNPAVVLSVDVDRTGNTWTVRN